MTDLLPLLEAAARESIPYGARVEIADHKPWFCAVGVDDKTLVSARGWTREEALRRCALAFAADRWNERTPALEALRQALRQAVMR